ncbi:ethylbenzene dehydrogenase-related protein [Aromatoleum buckelii]|uniref:Ethylbenzene dehydrogenase n=1 Tax=Aromatoleum buckelii TaxID=200254 RepID=A0ABX1N1G9_9RHOO|nr:ethylbenzene dehydrogenase-related protein [Aromatoleum buckelii]MCK0510594.1 ethylbenzene dehydrogenase-related protein [Aromatoleum buckelii]
MNKPDILVLTLSALLGATGAQAASPLQLQSFRTDQPIAIDGVPDKAWSKAVPLTLTLNELPYKPSSGYDGIKDTEAELRALHDDEHVYFLLRYEDPTESLQRFPWIKQADGSWKQMMNKDSTGHENQWYEDKVSLFWNIDQKGFEKKGCDMSCHLPENGLIEGVEDKSAGRHYTRSKGETVDMWHWKSTRTGPVGLADDQYVDASRQENKEWGRKSDVGTGGYYDNKSADGKLPAWMNGAKVTRHRHLVAEPTKVAFEDDFKPGDRVNGIVARGFEGSRADIAAQGVWKDGYWTLEIKRKRVTAGEGATEQDVQFADLARTYHFGLAIFDHAQINHLFHKKAVAFTFKR